MIEPAGALHAAALAAQHAAAFPPADRWDAATWRTLLAQPGVFGLIAAEGGAILAQVAADEAEILTLAVHPWARRQGLGRALLAAAEQAAATAGAGTMFLEVASGNVAARGLYAAAGYVEIGRRRRYYPDGDDALVLQRRLTPCAAEPG